MSNEQSDKKYAVINKKTYLVENLITANLLFKRLYQKQHKNTILIEYNENDDVDSNIATIGKEYIYGIGFISVKTKNELADDVDMPIDINDLRMSQFRIHLFRKSLLQKAKDFFKAQDELNIYWEYESVVYKGSNFAISLFKHFDFTKEDIDIFFIEANEIK